MIGLETLTQVLRYFNCGKKDIINTNTWIDLFTGIPALVYLHKYEKKKLVEPGNYLYKKQVLYS